MSGLYELLSQLRAAWISHKDHKEVIYTHIFLLWTQIGHILKDIIDRNKTILIFSFSNPNYKESMKSGAYIAQISDQVALIEPGKLIERIVTQFSGAMHFSLNIKFLKSLIFTSNIIWILTVLIQ